MMSDGGPAFPRPFSHDRPYSVSHEQAGMSMRDWFAATAPEPQVGWNLTKGNYDSPQGYHEAYAKEHARWNYLYADAMIAERDIEKRVK